MNSIGKILLDSSLNDKIFEGKYNSIKIHKEVYDDRFNIIYIQKCSQGLRHSDYNIGGYLDIKDKVLYEPDFWISDLINEDSGIKKSYFSDLYKKLTGEIRTKITEYVMENAKELKLQARDKFMEQTYPYIYRNEQEVIRNFIKSSESIPISLSYNGYFIERTNEYNTKNMFVDYLNNPQDVINKYVEEIIREDKETLGHDLLINEYENKYLEKVKKNENNEFIQSHISKKIYSSIKNLDIKTVNITIKYGKEELSFKYDYNKLLSDLTSGYNKSCDYGKAYETVSEFIRKVNNIDEKRRYSEEFSFDHISLITYSKKELYKNSNIKDSIKTKDRGDR